MAEQDKATGDWGDDSFSGGLSADSTETRFIGCHNEIIWKQRMIKQ